MARFATLVLAQKLAALRLQLWPTPPKLQTEYTQADYNRFMREETFQYSARYARQFTVIHGQKNLLEASCKTGVMMVFLHYGSWILAGGSITHHLGLPYTVIASRRNLETLSPEEVSFWSGVHERGRQLYGYPLFFTDQSPRLPLKWLKTTGHILGVALDVREYNQTYEEHPFQFLGHTLFMQSGPARLACIANVPMVPVTMQYNPQERRHHLYVDTPVYPNNDHQQMTQKLLHTIEQRIISAPEQLFCNAINVFSQRHQ